MLLFLKGSGKGLYIHRQSNHPPTFLRNTPKNINKRLPSISFSKSIFDIAVTTYQKVLDESGYNHKRTHNPQANQTTQSRKHRMRNIVWYNPPWISKKAVINVKNEDEYCFMWAVLAVLHPVSIHLEHVNHYEPYHQELNLEGIEFPISHEGIK